MSSFLVPRYPRMEWADSGGKMAGALFVEDSAVPYTGCQLRDYQQMLQLEAFRASQDANQEQFLAEQVCRK